MIKSYIVIQSENGKGLRYVRDIVNDSNGINGKYYAYTGLSGDSLADQTGTGKLMGDFLTIKSNIAAATSVNKFLIFPESSGDTEVLKRGNQNQTRDVSLSIITSVPIQGIASVIIVEEQIPEWFTGRGVY